MRIGSELHRIENNDSCGRGWGGVGGAGEEQPPPLLVTPSFTLSVTVCSKDTNDKGLPVKTLL